METNELKHYGVLGMKWGIRKDRVTSSRPKRRKLTKKQKKDRRKELKRKYVAGRKRVEARFDEDTMYLIRDTTAVAAGVLWCASALTTGNAAVLLNGTAAAANLISVIADKD